MILLITDFGHQGPYVGQIKAVLQQLSADQPVVDLMHDLPCFRLDSASYLLPALLHHTPVATVTLCVVDPGVGSERAPLALKVDGHWLVGPDNGLFDRLLATTKQVEWYEISWRPESLSHSFHGRDLFAPVAAAIVNGEWKQYLTATMARPLRFTEASLSRVIYIDGYGNCMTGISAEALSDEVKIIVAGQQVTFAKTFCEVKPRELFWYRNSLGLVEIAANQASAAQLLGMAVGDELTLD